MTAFDLLLRNVEVEGRAGMDVAILAGRVAEIGVALTGAAETIDGRGGALIPGLVDHHIHLLALAAQASSLALDATNGAGFARLVGDASRGRRAGDWLRVTGYHESMAGELNRHVLDRLAPGVRLRVQHRTGALWILNSAALEAVLDGEPPPFVERGPDGMATGRILRGDDWLRGRLADSPPSLREVGAGLAAMGITAVTDASVTTDATAAKLLADAVRGGDLPLRLRLMSGGALPPPADGAYSLGPVKILLDEARLPDFAEVTDTIARARAWNRRIAAHCVTATELAFVLAAFEAAGSLPGDRIEHGGVIPVSAIGALVRLQLTVVTQPAFVFERGDSYLAEVEPAEQGDLYRCASLLAAGVPVAGSSDAPYATPDPWLAIRAAASRRTRSGRALGLSERIDAGLDLFLSGPDSPGLAPRRVETGATADLCLLGIPLARALAEPSAEHVRATLVGGRVVYRRAMD